jgi:hypothetical protein
MPQASVHCSGSNVWLHDCLVSCCTCNCSYIRTYAASLCGVSPSGGDGAAAGGQLQGPALPAALRLPSGAITGSEDGLSVGSHTPSYDSKGLLTSTAAGAQHPSSMSHQELHATSGLCHWPRFPISWLLSHVPGTRGSPAGASPPPPINSFERLLLLENWHQVSAAQGDETGVLQVPYMYQDGPCCYEACTALHIHFVLSDLQNLRCM